MLVLFAWISMASINTSNGLDEAMSTTKEDVPFTPLIM